MEPHTHTGEGARELYGRETEDLIGSDKVEGTAVYNLVGEKIGSIERIMIEKVSGKATYAVLSFGGFLGIGDDHYPIPWAKLTYDQTLDGYKTDVSKAELEAAPRHRPEDDFSWFSHERGMDIYNHYGIPPYWI